MNLCCSFCQRLYPVDTREWRCECGGILEMEGAARFSRTAINTRDTTLWRYRAMLPIQQEEDIVSLGEGGTPLVETRIHGLKVLCKLEFLAPTGSFKDRGTTVLVSMLRRMGVTEVVEDSSGNAAASLAAYCARAGIHARIFAPAHASPAKLAQIEVYGAELVSVEGPREESALAAQRAVSEGEAKSRPYYASHNYSPFFVQGVKTLAFEIWEHLGCTPHNLVMPVGHGSLPMGAYHGFKELQAAGLIERMPRLIAVQARACAPLLQAYQQGLEDPKPVTAGRTVAEGISSSSPVRGRQMLRAIRETEGTVVAVDEGQILEARTLLARQGLYVEPTSATVAAALPELRRTLAPDEVTVLILTGNGLKSP